MSKKKKLKPWWVIGMQDQLSSVPEKSSFLPKQGSRCSTHPRRIKNKKKIKKKTQLKSWRASIAHPPVKA